MREISVVIKNSNISLVTLEGKIKPFGSIVLAFDCLCGTQNEPLLVYKGQFEDQKYKCTGCGKEYELGNNIKISPEIKS